MQTSLATFKEACTAVQDADLLDEVKSPVSKQAITFVLDGLSAAQPPAADRFTVAALSARIGLQPAAGQQENSTRLRWYAGR